MKRGQSGAVQTIKHTQQCAWCGGGFSVEVSGSQVDKRFKRMLELFEEAHAQCHVQRLASLAASDKGRDK
jgi:hypothetical protein